MGVRGVGIAILVALACQPSAAQDATERSRAALGWINAYRAAQGRPSLDVSAALSRAARMHAEDMARHGHFSHTGSDGSSVADRARRVGYRYCFIAENIARGQAGLDAVLNGWAASPGHRRNMLSRDAESVALVEAPGRVWVMVLGRAGC
ncbi:MAG: CAP domain-containing protein [Roseovarius sp.]